MGQLLCGEGSVTPVSNMKACVGLEVYLRSFIRSVDVECLVSRLGPLYPLVNTASAF